MVRLPFFLFRLGRPSSLFFILSKTTPFFSLVRKKKFSSKKSGIPSSVIALSETPLRNQGFIRRIGEPVPSSLYNPNFLHSPMFSEPMPHFFSCHISVFVVYQLFNVFLFVYTHTAKIHIIFNPARNKCIFTENFSIYHKILPTTNNKKGDLQKNLP